MRNIIHKDVERHLRVFCEEVGARPTGSEKNKIATDYIHAQLLHNGIESTLQKFDCIDWKGFDASLEIEGVALPVVVSDYSLPCDVQAKVINMSNLKELKERDIKGKIVVMRDDLTQSAIMPKNFRFWNPEEHQLIVRLLEEKQPEAIITVSFEGLTPVIEDGDFAIPVAVVNKDTGAILAQKDDVSAKLRINSERTATTGANVLGRIGTKRKKIILTAHFDTKPNTPGALDNATGCTVLLALSKAIASKNLPNTIEFVFLNGEDHYANAGEITYLDYALPKKEDISFNINIDGIGLKDSKGTVSFFGFSDEEKRAIEKLANEEGFDLETMSNWYQGDHMIFVQNGIPAIAMTSKDFLPLIDSVIHTPADNLSMISTDHIVEAVEFLVKLLENR
jgi:aminopeptidase YwaD